MQGEQDVSYWLYKQALNAGKTINNNNNNNLYLYLIFIFIIEKSFLSLFKMRIEGKVELYQGDTNMLSFKLMRASLLQGEILECVYL